MANPTVVINSITYTSVPEVDIPKQGGGTAKFYYTGDADADASMVLAGKTAFGASGGITGNMANNGSTSGTISTKSGTVTIPAGYTTGGTVSIATASVSELSANVLLNGKKVLGVTGTLQMPNISQDSTSKILSIS